MSKDEGTPGVYPGVWLRELQVNEQQDIYKAAIEIARSLIICDPDAAGAMDHIAEYATAMAELIHSKIKAVIRKD